MPAARMPSWPMVIVLFTACSWLPMTLIAAESASHSLASDPEVMRLLPRELVYQPEPLPADQNAAPILAEIRSAMLSTGGIRIRHHELAEFRESFQPLPSGPLRERIEEIVHKNEDCLGLMDRVVELGKVQFDNLTEANRIFEVSGIKRIAALRAELLAAKGDPKGAEEQLATLARFGTVIEDASGLGGDLMSDAAESMSRLAATYSVPPDLLCSFIQVLEENRAGSDEHSAVLLRTSFHMFCLSDLARLPDTGDLPDLLEALFELHRWSWPASLDGPKSQESKRWLEERERVTQTRWKERKQGVLGLLSDHPAAFDKAATIRLASRLYMEALRNSRVPPHEQVWEVEWELDKEVGVWPEALFLQAASFYTLTFPRKAEKQTLSPDELRSARAALSTVQNPLGKHLVAEEHPRTLVLAGPNSLAWFEGIKAVLAVQAYAGRHGELPASLEVLVKEGILRDLPNDPFDDTLRYSRSKRLIWSVGQNGKDEGGQGTPLLGPCPSPHDPDDQAWKIRIYGESGS